MKLKEKMEKRKNEASLEKLIMPEGKMDPEAMMKLMKADLKRDIDNMFEDLLEVVDEEATRASDEATPDESGEAWPDAEGVDPIQQFEEKVGEGIKSKAFLDDDTVKD